VLIALQRSGTFLIDKQGIMRYIHQVTNPQASVEKGELMREVEQL
jgi:peroxiredoxin